MTGRDMGFADSMIVGDRVCDGVVSPDDGGGGARRGKTNCLRNFLPSPPPTLKVGFTAAFNLDNLLLGLIPTRPLLAPLTASGAFSVSSHSNCASSSPQSEPCSP
jgi:hypothetical protein